MGDGTLSLVDEETPRRRESDASLILVLNAADPFEEPFAVSLAHVNEIAIGRGPERAVLEAGPGKLRLELADGGTSSVHARVVRDKRDVSVIDEQSKNGTMVNGRRITTAELGADDILEVGNNFFVVRYGAVDPIENREALRTFNGTLEQTYGLLARVAKSRVPLLFLGETGTGKELAARAAHDLSGRSGPFVPVNCGAIPGTLIESELFGVKKGAFSDAHADRAGMVVAADRGTLLLDEVAELPEASQAALLRVLQDGEVVALGASRPHKVDVRVMAATHQDLPARVAVGKFRRDLYARLHGHQVTLPPLRARREDMGLLCQELLVRAAGSRAHRITLQRAAARALLLYNWPHNIRELEQVLRRAVAILEGTELRTSHLPEELVVPRGKREPENLEARLIQLLRENEGNLTAVSRALGTSRSQVQRLIQRYDIKVALYRNPGEPSTPDSDDDE